jgi:hypothetical protein
MCADSLIANTSIFSPLKFTGLRVGLFFYFILALTRSTHGAHAPTVTYVVVATLP